MRKEFVLGFVFILLGFSFVSAATCDDDQTIMRLYSATNSHVSAWDQSPTYVEKVCYDDIFGRAYTAADPHVCDSENRVLSLSDVSNAHATSDTSYNYDVCYGDLECVYDSSDGDGCSNDGEIVVRMSSVSNAHVSYASDLNYPIKVCCLSSPVYWSDMNGVEIIQSDVDDSVKLVAKGISSGTFAVWDKDAIIDDPIIEIIGESVGSDLVGIWEIEQGDYDEAKDIAENFKQFYFKIDEQESDYLSINGDVDDSLVTVNVMSPMCGEHYDKGDVLAVAIDASDIDDLITGNVRLGSEVFDFTNGVFSFSVNLDSPGSLQIIVEAFARNEKVRIINNIMVLDKTAGVYADGEYVAACITEPKDLSRIDGTIVSFSASTTRGLRVIDGIRYSLVPDNGDIFSWDWTFRSPGIDDSYMNFIDTNEVTAYNFIRRFFGSGDNSASLVVGVNEFGNDGICIDGELCP